MSSAKGRLFSLGLNELTDLIDIWMKKYKSQGSSWQEVNIGSGDGLVPNRQKVNIWTDDDSTENRLPFYVPN